MAYDNKPNFDNKQFEQCVSDVINLSGTTIINGNLVIPQDSGIGKAWISDTGGTGGWKTAIGESILKRITLPSHGFQIKDVIGWSGGTYNKAIANGIYDGEVLGVVTNCFDVNAFELTLSGYVCGLSGLTVNCTYFLSDTIAGLLTTNEPTTVGSVSKSILIAHSDTTGWMLPYAGYIITSGSTAMGSTPSIGFDVDFPNNSLYYSCDANKLVYKDPTGGTHNLY